MTEQQACTLCGAGGHTAAQCNWNDRRLTFTLESLTEALGNVMCLHELGVELIAANLFRQHPEQAEGAQGERVPDEAFEAEFMTWWEEHGQYCRSGGGDYERTFAFQAWRHLYPKLMQVRADVERICEKVRSFEQTTLTCSRIQGETIGRLRRERDQALVGKLPQAWLDVHAERRRQVDEEAFDPSHDDMATRGQLARAAGCYALHAGGVGTNWPKGIGNGSALFWPWDKDWWKPKAPRETLIRAGALILAELERIDRAAAAAQGGE